jgi:hypothetical protein
MGTVPFAICSALAWSLGQSELRMYRSLGAVGVEESQAKAGYVLGVLGTLLSFVVILGGTALWILIGFALFAALGGSFEGVRLLTEF